MKRSKKKFFKHMDKLLVLLRDLFADQHPAHGIAACCGYIIFAVREAHPKDRKKAVSLLREFMQQVEEDYADADAE
jgi:hypothetical protein